MQVSLNRCHHGAKRSLTYITLSFLTVLLSLASWLPIFAATQIDIAGPAGSGSFGQSVTILTNGNFVVTDPFYDLPNGTADVGAVYLYNGTTNALMSTLTGSRTDDRVGSDGVKALSNGNFLVISPFWDNGSATNAGAVTWVSGANEASGVVNSSNSLVGSTANDQVGQNGVIVLTNGNYLVASPFWNNGATPDAGAVTWGDGTTGVRGAVGSSNSLVGNGASAQVGSGGVVELTNGNYVVNSPNWPNSLNFGAVTWGDGSSGIKGEVNSSNSLVGSHGDDRVGALGVMTLSNGNYVVRSPFWDNGIITDVGAVTWGDGSSGIKGAVSSSNSLVGFTNGDNVGFDSVIALGNGNYVVRSPFWDNGPVMDAGAVTWGNGSSGIKGVVNSSNSLVGSHSDDRVGALGVMILRNGNYVVVSPYWDSGNVTNVGAVTWGDGSSGIKGEVSNSNSLIGSTSSDYVGVDGVIALSNGNYVVRSPFWDNGIATDAGAVTWGDGSSGIKGVVSSSNSLVGNGASAQVGSGGVVELTNGNYLVRSPSWPSSLSPNYGAVTWGDGAKGISGLVSSSNSLVGSTSDDNIGLSSVTILNNGNYVVASPGWDNGSVTDAGAVTWGDGVAGTSGVVGSSNSLVGSSNGDGVGFDSTIALSNGNYVVRSPYWDNGSVVDTGAVTWGSGSSGIKGVVSSSNSLVGSMSGDNVGINSVTILSNSNYVVVSPVWDNGLATDAGAVTWGNGNSGVKGVVSSSNSLVGSTSDNFVGFGGVIALSNGNYVVRSPMWDNGITTNAGAVTWGNGNSGIKGEVNSSNSLVGSINGDNISSDNVIALSSGDYIVHSSGWDNGIVTDAGAVTWGDGSSGIQGMVSSSNSVTGKVANSGTAMRLFFDAAQRQLFVGRPVENIVTRLRLTFPEIAVEGKTVAIGNGDSSPNSSDGTDLSAVVVGANGLAQNFTISNTGDGALTVNAITLSGAQAGDFSISGVTLPRVVAPNSALNFTLNFAPKAVGLRTATVNIANNDADENPYTFAVQGTGTQHTLTTNKTGSGTGSITLSPAGGNYNHNTVVTVTAKADTGSTFAGWSGDCSGAGSCSVTMTSAKSVTATFNKNASGNTQTVYLPLITK